MSSSHEVLREKYEVILNEEEFKNRIESAVDRFFDSSEQQRQPGRMGSSNSLHKSNSPRVRYAYPEIILFIELFSQVFFYPYL